MCSFRPSVFTEHISSRLSQLRTSFMLRRRRNVSFHVTWGIFVFLFIFMGCGKDAAPTYPTAVLQGAVTIDGAPVKDGSIQFMPEPGTLGHPTNATILDGKYMTKTAPKGKIRALLVINRPTGKMIKEYSKEYPELENLVPEKYRTGIELNVTGDASIPFELVNSKSSN